MRRGYQCSLVSSESLLGSDGANKDLAKDCGPIKTLLPPGKNYPARLAKAVRCAELGAIGRALTMCELMIRQAKDKDAVDGLRQDIVTAAEARMQGDMEILGDAAKASPLRFDAYIRLKSLSGELRDSEVAKSAEALVAKLASDPAIVREQEADAAYQALSLRIKRATGSERAKLSAELEAFAKKYTAKHAEAASAEAADIGTAKSR
jgi:hypothetical protein